MLRFKSHEIVAQTGRDPLARCRRCRLLLWNLGVFATGEIRLLLQGRHSGSASESDKPISGRLAVLYAARAVRSAKRQGTAEELDPPQFLQRPSQYRTGVTVRGRRRSSPGRETDYRGLQCRSHISSSLEPCQLLFPPRRYAGILVMVKECRRYAV